ncbi:hypothetical protein F9K84_20880 [Brucella anthropi]|nr:hypothetical protein F9K84_20880 [Brucella anthropi]
MVPAWSSCHGISCSRHLSRSQAEIPLIPPVQISRATSLCAIPTYDSTREYCVLSRATKTPQD